MVCGGFCGGFLLCFLFFLFVLCLFFNCFLQEWVGGHSPGTTLAFSSLTLPTHKQSIGQVSILGE